MLATGYVSMYVASYVTMVMMLLLMYDGHKDKSQVATESNAPPNSARTLTKLRSTSLQLRNR